MEKLKVTAKDSAGNIFEKIATLGKGVDGPVISFGWPAEYNFERLKEYYPFQKPLCIDAGGRNHLGHSDVSISATDMNKVIEHFTKGGEKS